MAYEINGSNLAQLNAVQDALYVAFTPQEGFANGILDAGPALRALMTQGAGGTIRIPRGDYYVAMTGDADTIMIPANTDVRCDPGANFIYDYWGSPLFGIVEVDNVRFSGYTITYKGTFQTTTGNRTFKTWTMPGVPAYRYCTDIALLGSNYAEISGRHKSDVETHVNNGGIYVDGPDDGTSFSYGHNINIIADDRCCSITSCAIAGFYMKVVQGRNPQDSFNLYGSGHAIYDIIDRNSKDGLIEVVDNGLYVDSLSLVASHSLSIKNATNVKSKILSQRSAGPLNYAQTLDCDFEFIWSYGGTVDNSSAGAIYYTGQGGVSYNNKFRGILDAYGSAHNSCLFSTYQGATINAIYNNSVDVAAARQVNGSENAMFYLGDQGGHYKASVRQYGNQTRTVCEFKGSSYVTFEACIEDGGARCLGGTGVGNTYTFSGVGASKTGYAAVPRASLTVSQTLAQYKNYVQTAATTTPSAQFQLPTAGGAFLVHVTMTSTDKNNARAGLYWVVFDDASTNDFTTAQLIGAQITKGTLGPTAMTVTVDATGLVTASGSGGTSIIHQIEFGYREIYSR